jgi:ABC-type antimicrobial peptide transport system permease subunit
MDDLILRSIARERLVATTSACFAGLALVLATVGLFGVTAVSVVERTSELGLRIAIGATPWDVVRDALRESARLSIAGTAIGAAGALALALAAESWISGLLFELKPADGTNVAVAALLMTCVFAAACVAPAVRAARIDPLRALRHE